jgi:hypothetical protein
VQVRSNFALKARPPGTEFLDAETGRPKSAQKCASAHGDQNPGSEWPEIPAETPYSSLQRSSEDRRLVIRQAVIQIERLAGTPFRFSILRSGFGNVSRAVLMSLRKACAEAQSSMVLPRSGEAIAFVTRWHSKRARTKGVAEEVRS